MKELELMGIHFRHCLTGPLFQFISSFVPLRYFNPISDLMSRSLYPHTQPRPPNTPYSPQSILDLSHC
jgi:hypothetical protein